MKITVDFNSIIGEIKPMHGTNCGPMQGGAGLSYDFRKEFEEIGIPYVRLHDVEYPYGAGQFVDIHCIFPDFDADENDERSYNFTHTDIYLKAIEDAGAKVFYRLGESIDHFSKKLFIDPPKNSLKWAVICEHIIRHYNEGWADGFHMNIEYWEIWNEPDNDHMWLGTSEEFYELYRVSANHLKKCFGDSIKIGGYASSGFYANNRKAPSEWFISLIPFMNGFFKYITDEKTKAPIDFFSWHCYADTPEEIALHSEYAAKLLDSYGLTDCESILDEFNMYYCFGCFTPYHSGSFADIAASLITAQKSDIDIFMHYGIFPRSTYNNLFAMDIDGKSIIRFAGFNSFKAFGSLYRLGSEVKTSGEKEGELYVLAAKNDSQGGIMIVSRDFEGEIEVDIGKGDFKTFRSELTDDKKARGEANVTVSEETPLKESILAFKMEKNQLLYISLK